jgi:hypothetical protein
MRYTSLILLILSLFLTACTQKSQDITSTLDEALFGFADINKSRQEINALPYASSHVIIDDGAQIFVVLALAEPSPSHPEQTQLKWLSADHAMLVTENGRLIKTLRLPTDNLMAVSDNKSVDPLRIAGKKPDNYSWSATYDWQPGYRYNYKANLTWKFIERKTIRSAAWEKETDYYQERVTVPALNAQFTNHFWLDKDSHQVVKSIQYLGPEMPTVEMTILKPFSG